MARKILIKKAFEDGNRLLFENKKTTYANISKISEVIAEITGINKINVFVALNRWYNGKNGFTETNKNSKAILDCFFEILNLNLNDYILMEDLYIKFDNRSEALDALVALQERGYNVGSTNKIDIIVVYNCADENIPFIEQAIRFNSFEIGRILEDMY